MTDTRHVVMLAGQGGLTPLDTIPPIAEVTRSVSCLYVATGADPEPSRRWWSGQGEFDGEFVIAPTAEELLRQALALHERRPIHGVATYAEDLLGQQAEIANALGLPGNSVSAVTIAQSKARQRIAFAQHQVPTPQFAIIRDVDDLPVAAGQVRFPAVLKASVAVDGRGVRIVEDPDRLAYAYAELLAARATFACQDPLMVLEERMSLRGEPGCQYANYCSVESLLSAGAVHHLAVSDRLGQHHGHIEEGLALPSRMDADRQCELIDCADRAIAAIGLVNGAVHTEIALTPAGPKIIEVNARSGGPVEGAFRAVGYNYGADVARSALGQPLTPPTAFDGVAWFRVLPAPEGEFIAAGHTSLDELHERFADLFAIRVFFRPGDRVGRHHQQFLAGFVVRGRDFPGTIATAEAVEEALAIRLRQA
jgi:biotin carboxylase